MADTVPPYRFVADAVRWARWIQERTVRLSTVVERLQRSTGNDVSAQAGTIKMLGQQIQDLQTQQAYLASLAEFQYAEFAVGLTGFAGWYSGSLPSVAISTPTGRLEVGYGGALNGGDGYFCYSVVGAASGVVYVDRGTILGNPARYVAITGGASFTPSGYKTVVIDAPPAEPLTVRLEISAEDAFVYFAGGSISARVVP